MSLHARGGDRPGRVLGRVRKHRERREGQREICCPAHQTPVRKLRALHGVGKPARLPRMWNRSSALAAIGRLPAWLNHAVVGLGLAEILRCSGRRPRLFEEVGQHVSGHPPVGPEGRFASHREPVVKAGLILFSQVLEDV